MPPKAVPASTDLTEKNVAILKAALCSVNEFKPDWPYVLKEFGLGKGGHGLRGFKAALAKLGLDFKENKFSPIDDKKTDNAPAPPAAATPTKPTTKANATASGKKRKGSAPKGDTEDEEGSKKPKLEEDNA